jgi:hypothetical protein
MPSFRQVGQAIDAGFPHPGVAQVWTTGISFVTSPTFSWFDSTVEATSWKSAIILNQVK